MFMAKAKKSETKKAEVKAEKPAPAAKAKKAPAAKKHAAPAAGQPMIDTSLAAANAAKLLAGGFNKPASSTNPSGNKTESAMFKNLKAGLNKPSSAAMSNLLDKSHGPEPTKSHTGFNKQVGHNQTYGADVNRSGVPRRTPG
jgi:hypothetical protein